MKTNFPQTPRVHVAQDKKRAKPIFAVIAVMITGFAIYQYNHSNWAVGFYREKHFGWTLELKPNMNASYNLGDANYNGTYRVLDDQVILSYFNPACDCDNNEGYRRTPTGLKTFGAHFERE